MIYRPQNDTDDVNMDAWWKRKQSVKENRVTGEAKAAPADLDAEPKHYPGYKGESGKSRTGKDVGDIWDDEAWKDKDQ